MRTIYQTIQSSRAHKIRHVLPGTMPPRKQQPRGISCSGKSVTRCGAYILNGDDAFVWEDPDYDDSPAYEPLAEETDFLIDIVPREEAAAHAKCAAPSSTGGPGAQNPPQAQ